MQRTEKDNKRNAGNGDRAFAALFKMWRIKVMEKKWIENSLVAIFLLLNAYWDIRERRVLLWSIRVFGVMGMVLLLFVENEMIRRWYGCSGMRNLSWFGRNICNAVLRTVFLLCCVSFYAGTSKENI